MGFHDLIRRGGGNIGLPVELPNRPPVHPFRKQFTPPKPQGGGGRGFLATFMKLAKQVIPSTRKELERRLESKLDIEREDEEIRAGGGGGAGSLASGGRSFGNMITYASQQPNLVGDPMIVLGSPDNLTPSLIGNNIVPYETAASAEQAIKAQRASPFRRSEEAQELVSGRNPQVRDIPNRPSGIKPQKKVVGLSDTLEDKKGKLVFNKETGKWERA